MLKFLYIIFNESEIITEFICAKQSPLNLNSNFDDYKKLLKIWILELFMLQKFHLHKKQLEYFANLNRIKKLLFECNWDQYNKEENYYCYFYLIFFLFSEILRKSNSEMEDYLSNSINEKKLEKSI